MKLFKPLYERALRGPNTRSARDPVVLSLCEAVFFPIAPEVMLAPMALARRDRALRYAAISLGGSVIGMDRVCAGLFRAGRLMPLIEWLGLLPARPVSPRSNGRPAHPVKGFWLLLVAGFVPVPFKIFTLASGAVHMPLLPFFAGATIGRGKRVFLVAGAIKLGGPKRRGALHRWIEPIGWALPVLLVGLVIYFKYIRLNYCDDWGFSGNVLRGPCGRARLSGCASTGRRRSRITASTPARRAAAAATASPKPAAAPGGTYRVQRGDTIYSIAFRHGVDYRDLAEWNGIPPPYTIYPGRELRSRPRAQPRSHPSRRRRRHRGQRPRHRRPLRRRRSPRRSSRSPRRRRRRMPARHPTSARRRQRRRSLRRRRRRRRNLPRRQAATSDGAGRPTDKSSAATSPAIR